MRTNSASTNSSSAGKIYLVSHSSHAAQQGHGRVRVAVDQARHDNTVAAFKLFVGLIFREYFAGRANRNDDTLVHGDGGIRIEAAVELRRGARGGGRQR